MSYDFPATRKADQEQEQEWAQEVMRGLKGRVFFTRTSYGRGETDYVRIYVAEKRDKISDVTYYAARANGDFGRIHRNGLAFGGGGYSKGLEAADMAYRAANGGAALDQSKWREL